MCNDILSLVQMLNDIAERKQPGQQTGEAIRAFFSDSPTQTRHVNPLHCGEGGVSTLARASYVGKANNEICV